MYIRTITKHQKLRVKFDPKTTENIESDRFRKGENNHVACHVHKVFLYEESKKNILDTKPKKMCKISNNDVMLFWILGEAAAAMIRFVVGKSLRN